MSKIIPSLAGAALVGLLSGASAMAQEAVTILGISPLEQCSNAAANAQRLGTAGQIEIDLCSDAIARSWSTEGELAVGYRNRGILRLARHEPDLAAADFTRAIKADPGYASAYNDRGVAYSMMHRMADATRDYTMALKLNAVNADQVHFNRAMAYEDQGDLKQAYQDYREAAELNPGWEQPARELARFTVR